MKRSSSRPSSVVPWSSSVYSRSWVTCTVRLELAVQEHLHRRRCRRGRGAPCGRRSGGASCASLPATMRCRSDVPVAAVGELALVEHERQRVLRHTARLDRRAGVAVEPVRAEVRLGRQWVVGRVVGEVERLRQRRVALGEQRADRVLGLRVVALAELGLADVAARVDQVLGRPVLVPVGVPGAVVVVDRDRVVDAVLVRSPRGRWTPRARRRTRACGRRRSRTRPSRRCGTRPRGRGACAGS